MCLRSWNHLSSSPGDRQERAGHCGLRRKRGGHEVAAVHVVWPAIHGPPAIVDDGGPLLQSLRVDELVAFAEGLCLPMPPMAGAMCNISQPVGHPGPGLLLLAGVADDDAESLLRIRNLACEHAGVADDDAESLVRICNLACEHAERVHHVQVALGVSSRRRNVHVGHTHRPPTEFKHEDLRLVEHACWTNPTTNDTDCTPRL